MEGAIRKLATLFKGRVVSVDAVRVDLPTGQVAEYEIVRHPGSAAVVAMDGDGRVCLLRQYRPAAGGWIWELPAGRREPGEEPQDAARRELAEEAGCAAREWRSLGPVLSTPGVCSEEIHLFLATTLTPHPARHEPYEAIEVHWVDLGEAERWALEGQVRDAKSIAGLLRAGSVVRGA